MSKPKYDSTVARVAGNIFSGRDLENANPEMDLEVVKWAVKMARAIVAETIRTSDDDQG